MPIDNVPVIEVTEAGEAYCKEHDYAVSVLLSNELRNLRQEIVSKTRPNGGRHDITVTDLARWATALEKIADQLDPAVGLTESEGRVWFDTGEPTIPHHDGNTVE